MPSKPSHSSLDRPLATALEGGLPPGAIPYGTNSAWPIILMALERKRGVWHALQRVYSHPSNAVSSARKWAETLFDEATCERLEAAWTPAENGGARVYMRIRAEGQRPFVAPDGEPEEEEEEEPEPEGLLPPESHAVAADTQTRRLSGKDILAIRRRVAAGEKQSDLAHEYGVSQATVSRYVNRTRGRA